MSTLTHPKFHRHNHHTTPTNGAVYPDAAHDPIASYDFPFQGDFVCDSKIVSNDDNQNFNFKHTNLALFVSSSDTAISAIGDALFNGNLEAHSISFNEQVAGHAQYITTTDIGRFWVVYINDKPYGIRLWNETTKTAIHGKSPFFLNNTTTTSYLSSSDTSAVSIAVSARGTAPMNLQWYVDSLNTITHTYHIANTNLSVLTVHPAVTADTVTYQWWMSGNNIPLPNSNVNKYLVHSPGTYTVKITAFNQNQYLQGETDAILVCTHAGRYRCIASNAFGTLTSADLNVY